MKIPRSCLELIALCGRCLIKCQALLFISVLYSSQVAAQTPELPTRGTEFWLGYMQNAYGAQTLSVRIGATSATSGTVSMPGSGWSQAFAVGANSVATVVVPNTAEHVGGEVVENKAVVVQSVDSVTVTAVSFQSFTTDGTQVLPAQALGTSYRAEAYRGLPGFGDFYKSELLIVATQDGTEIQIIPSVNTSGGRPAGVPFLVLLDAGETYQVQGALASLDLTGTSVTATANSGPCRMFAVFGGSMCANVPVTCPACDHLFEQMTPTNTWGTEFLTVPVGGAITHTYRITADQNGTSVTINGGAPIMLNGGQSWQVNGANAPACIVSSAPVSVVQMMEGYNCSGAGDPSMIVLLPVERLSKKVTFTTVNSPQITSHHVNVIVAAGSTGSVTLDGVSVGMGAFTPYVACPNWAHAMLSLAAGDHTLISTAGFIAYAQGSGTGESYAFAVANNAPPVILQDSVICTTDPVTLTSPVAMDSAIWYALSDPGTILATGLTYTFTPVSNDTYVVVGELPVSHCPMQFEWQVGIPVDPAMILTANGGSPASVCQFEPVQLDASPAPDPLWYDLQWTPAGPLSNANIPNPIAYPMQDTWFTLDVTSPVGCGSFTDSVFVTVSPNDVFGVHTAVDDDAICAGESTTLHVDVEQVIGSDFFEVAPGAMWSSVQGGVSSTACGSVSGSALYFNGAAWRNAQTNGLNVVTGGWVHFALKIASGAAPCENAEPGEDVLLEYSTNGGLAWNTISTFNEAAYPAFTPINLAIPVPAQTANTIFRWRQVNHSGAGQDNWALDNVMVTHLDNSGLNFSWSPAPWVNNPASTDPIASPASSTWFIVDVSDPLSTCSWTDSVYIEVQPAFSLALNNDTTLCALAPVQLSAVPSSGSGITYVWTPNNGTLNSLTSASPLATPSATTTYSVTATTDIGCTDTESMTITVSQLQGIFVGVVDPHLCPGETTQLNGTTVSTGPVTLAWLPNNGTLSTLTGTNPFATPLDTTTYTCTATDVLSGCTMTGSAVVYVHGPYTLTLTPDDTLCTTLGEQLNVQHNVPAPFTIAWSPAAFLNSTSIASPTIMLDTSAIYSVTITDAFGCTGTDSTLIAVAFDDLLSPVFIDGCDGQPVLLDAGYPGSSYDWSNGATSQTITVAATGSFTVTITDIQGCTAVKTFNLTFHAPPVVDLGPDTVACGAPFIVLDAGAPGNTYLWSTSATTQQITVSTSGPYSVVVTNAFNCSSSDTIGVQFFVPPQDVLVDVTACETALPTLDAGNAGSTFLWNTGATTQTIVAGTSGTYSVTITTTQNCSATYDAVVLLVAEPVVDLGSDSTLCQGETLLLDAGNPGSTYLWSTLQTSQTISVTTTGLYHVTVSNSACAVSDTIEVVFNLLPTDNLVDQTHCIDDPVVLDAGNLGSTYLWNTGATTQQLTCATAGTYTVTITTMAGCSASFDATVTYVGFPSFELGPDTILCDGEVLTLDPGYPTLPHLWNTGSTASAIDVTQSGTYSVTVNNGYCTWNDGLQATFNPVPNRLITHEHFACLDEEPRYVVIDAGNAGSAFEWNTGDTAQVILAGAYGWYFVQVTNNFDCSTSDSTHVIEHCPASIYVPNTFTPNGDGTNDVWMPVGKNIAALELYVFDRWGGIIFGTDAVGTGWDGTQNGTEVKNDVYVWRMRYRYVDSKTGQVGEEHEQLGHVTVLR